MHVRFDFILGVKIASRPLTIATGVLWLGMVQQGGDQLLGFSVRLPQLPVREMSAQEGNEWGKNTLRVGRIFSARLPGVTGVEGRRIFGHRITFCHIEGGRLED